MSEEPTFVLEDGTSVWWRDGMYKRDFNLPAVVHADGTCEWWSNGEMYHTTRNSEVSQ